VKVVAKYNKMNFLVLVNRGKENPSVEGWMVMTFSKTVIDLQQAQ
jgi:hypothetical protein